ncbi:MAG: Gfo/Idh/MocA family oxidoreductase, partial [Cytophagales bacterium]|nr:Gfo/Idh/MocA family oxidoreductase [Cytophagales bacterium]
MEKSRRAFIKKSLESTAALSVGGVLPAFSARSYSNILNANGTIIVSVMGVNSRGTSLAKNFARQKNCEVAHICDVDARAIAKCTEAVRDRQARKPVGYVDIRKSLESKDVDALVIAAPDHWHAPATLMALQAGKH